MKSKDVLMLESIYSNKVQAKQTLKTAVRDFFAESGTQASPKLIDSLTTLFEQAVDQQVVAELQGPATEMIQAIKQQYKLSDEQVEQLIQQLQQAQGDPEKIKKILQTIDQKATQAFQQVQQPQQTPANESLQHIVENAWIQATSTLLTENFAPTDKTWMFLFEDLQSSISNTSILLTEGGKGQRDSLGMQITALKRQASDYLKSNASEGNKKRISDALSRFCALAGGTTPTTPAGATPTTPAGATKPGSKRPAGATPTTPAGATPTTPAGATPTQPKQGFFSKAKDLIGKKLSGGWNWIKNNKWKTLGAAGALGALGVIAATGGAAALPLALAKAGTAALGGAKVGAAVGGIKGAISSQEQGVWNRIKSGAKGALKGAAVGAAVGGLGSLASSAAEHLAGGASGPTGPTNADIRVDQQQEVNAEFKDNWRRYSNNTFNPKSIADKTALQNILNSVKQQGLDLSQMSGQEKADLFNKAWKTAIRAVRR